MDRAGLLEHLEAAKRHAGEDRIHIQSQKATIASLRANGSDATEAEQKLQTFEKMQDNHLADIERLQDALSKTRLGGDDQS